MHVVSEAAPSIALIVPTHDSAEVLPDCLSALGASPGLQITVVDNCSSDGSDLLAQRYQVRVLRLPTNTGFAHACNMGALAVSGMPDWLGFVNPDVTLSGESFLRMVREAPPHVTAISPLLLDDQGRPLRDIARVEPALGATALRYLASSVLERRARRLYEHLRNASVRYLAVEVTSGGCLLVRTAAFRAAGGFCDAYFFNMEDVELSCRIRAAGGLIVVDRDVIGLHAKGTSSKSVTQEQRMLECARAEVLFFERNRPAWQTLVVAPAVLVGCLARMVIPRARSRADWWTLARRGSTLLKALGGSVVRRLSGHQPPRPGKSLFFDSPPRT